MERKPNARESDKASRERQIFGQFAEVANATCNLQVDLTSIESNRPPEPDIKCKLRGTLHFFEMVEITDEALARNVSISMREMKITGGFFSQDLPLTKAFESKAQRSYSVLGGPLELLTYYGQAIPTSCWRRARDDSFKGALYYPEHV